LGVRATVSAADHLMINRQTIHHPSHLVGWDRTATSEGWMKNSGLEIFLDGMNETQPSLRRGSWDEVAFLFPTTPDHNSFFFFFFFFGCLLYVFFYDFFGCLLYIFFFFVSFCVYSSRKCEGEGAL
jgi:hypothetical protein